MTNISREQSMYILTICCSSSSRSFKLRWRQVSNSTQLEAINFNPKRRPRRQDWPGELIETGMFYFARRHLIEYEGLLQNYRLDINDLIKLY